MTEKEKYVLEHYEVAKEGEVFSTLNSNNNFERKELSLREDKDGYLDVTLVYNDEGGRQPFRVNRLVALKHIKNPNNLPIVNHKNTIKKDNSVNNLEWTTVKANTQHGYDNGAYENIKRVKVIELSKEEKIFPSVSHTSRHYGYKNPSTIQSILEGRKNNPISRGSRKGLFFEYTDEEITHIK